jgi:predicted nucleotidyltransferase
MKKNLRQINKGINKFCKKVVKELEPECIILYGSFSRGDFNERSDVDLIVISSKLPEAYLERAERLLMMVKTPDPIEPLGFTPNEFITMIKKRHCTSLFAMEEGRAIYGIEYFLNLKKIHKKIVRDYKIIKESSSWVSHLSD